MFDLFQGQHSLSLVGFRWYLAVFMKFQAELGHVQVISGEFQLFPACSKENFGNI